MLILPNVEKLFAEALNFPAGSERQAFLRKATREMPAIMTELEDLLRIHEESNGFLEISAPEQDPTLFLASAPELTERVEQQVLELFEPDPTGESLGNIRQFTIRSLLGSSGSSVVYLARDTLLQRDVAIKILSPILAAHAEHRSRFLNEAKAIASIHHDNVVSVFEVGELKGLPIFVMEYLPTGSLQAHLLREGPLNFLNTLKIGKQVAEGLAAAHRAGLLHRDIKPSNVLIDAFPDRVKISDFGLVCSMLNTISDLALGTPQFCSPEQILGELVDHRSDMFGLGCLLHALLIGKSPFSGTSCFQMLELTLKAQPEPLERFGIQVPADFEKLLFQLLEKDRNRRPENIEQVVSELERMLIDEQTPPSRRHFLKLGAGLTGVVGVAGLVSALRWRNSGARLVLSANQPHFFALYDGQMDPFLHSSRGVKQVFFEELIIRTPIHYWRADKAGEWGEVIYQFDFNQPLASCEINLKAFASFGLDPECEVIVKAGSDLTRLVDVVHYRRERCEYWPTPGNGPSYPDLPNLGLNTIEGPQRRQDLSAVMHGGKTLFIVAELFATKDIPTEKGGTLGPAAAQFLRCNLQTNENPLSIYPRPLR